MSMNDFTQDLTDASTIALAGALRVSVVNLSPLLGLL